ncbi:MAG: hypothetical protein J6X00_01325 [Clostridia bacterium]|nr:hypothetical protein [Clostridia bacterium]
MFKAMWNNFYNWAVRDASTLTKTSIILVLFILGMVTLVFSIKKGKDGKPISNWFLFWVAILIVGLAITYVILIS